MKHSFAFACALILLAAASVHLLMGNARDGLPSALGRVASDAEVELPREVAADLGPVSSEAPSPVAERVEVLDAPGVTVGANDEREVLIAGTVLIEELDGSWTRDALGSLRATVWGNGSVPEVVLPIRAGHWELTKQVFEEANKGKAAEPGSEVKFDQVRLLGRRTSVFWDTKRRMASLGVQDHVLKFKAVGSPRLIVEDESGAKAIDEIVVLDLGGGRGFWHAHPGLADRKEVLLSGMSPPFDLVVPARLAKRGSVLCLVGSAGYAWQPVTVGMQPGAETRVRLKRSGSFELYLETLPKERDLFVRVYRAGDERPLTDFRVYDQGPYLLDGLEAGLIDVRVERGSSPWAGLELVAAEVQIVVDRQARLTLAVPPPVEPVKAGFAGRVTLDRAWDLDDFSVELIALGARGADGSDSKWLSSSDMATGGDGVFDFDFGELEIGRYELKLNDPYWYEVFELGEAGIADFNFRIPKPVTISVLLRDESGGGVADISRISWRSVRRQRSSGGRPPSSQREFGDDRFYLRLPEGPTRITGGGKQFANFSKEIDAVDGMDVVIEMSPPSGVLIYLTREGQAVPWVLDLKPGELISKPAPGYMNSVKHAEGGLWIGVSEPGHYSLVIPQIEGYENHAPVEVDIVRGETTQVNVELTWVP